MQLALGVPPNGSINASSKLNVKCATSTIILTLASSLQRAERTNAANSTLQSKKNQLCAHIHLLAHCKYFVYICYTVIQSCPRL